MLRLAALDPDRTIVVRDMAAAVALLAPDLVGRPTEVLRVAHLDRDWRLVGLSAALGQACAIDLPVRAIFAEALELDAAALILAHNHPGGDPTPSAADRIETRRLADAARLLDLRLVDHLIFAGDRHFSFRARGWL